MVLQAPVEGRLLQAMDLNGISDVSQERIFDYLKVLNDKHPDTAQHSMRVGLLAGTIARIEAIPGITPKMLIWAGCLHDVGKVVVDLETLNKVEKFTKKDMKKMEPHVIMGWQMLDKLHDYTAAIVVRHHQFGPKPYPAKLPELPSWLEPKKDLINKAARTLALADYYDALMTRKNDKNAKPVKGKKAAVKKELTGEEKRQLFYRDNGDKGRLIALLEEQGVFRFPE
jgi:putative nucleotidyltransferase with HDIG domain